MLYLLFVKIRNIFNGFSIVIVDHSTISEWKMSWFGKGSELRFFKEPHLLSGLYSNFLIAIVFLILNFGKI